MQKKRKKENIYHMMSNIDMDKLVGRIAETRPLLNERSTAFYAEYLVKNLHESLQEAFEAFVEGKEVPDVPAPEDYSLHTVKGIANCPDWLEAFELFNAYLRDPKAGLQLIWLGTRDRG